MDKKSNRTDLLAAGRKKLQQYRQKKDHKGKDGKGKDGKGNSKSSSKANKSEEKDADADVVSTAPKMDPESSIVHEGEVESSASLPSTAENAVDGSIDSQKIMVTSTDSENLDQLPAPASGNAGAQAVLDVNVDSPSMDPALVEASSNHKLDTEALNEEGALKVVDHEVGGVESSFKSETLNDDDLTHFPDSIPRAACDAEAVAAVPLEVEGPQEGDQEADSFVPKHCDQSAEPELVADSELSVSAYDGAHATSAVSDGIADEPTSLEPGQIHDASEIAVRGFDGDPETVGASVPVQMTHIGVETITSSPGKLHPQGEDVMDASSDESALYLRPMSIDGRNYENEAHQMDSQIGVDEGRDERRLSEDASMLGIESHDELVEIKNVYSVGEELVNPGAQGNSMNLFELAEVLNRLPQRDFEYLIKSRDQSNLVAPKNDTTDVSETFQEQIYLANISKELFHLQLLEQNEQPTDVDHQHHMLLDEVAILPQSLSNAEERNKSLAAELSHCKSELQAAIRERAELQDLYHIAKDDVMTYSAKVDELKMKLEESVGQLSSLSVELGNCRVLLEASQVENGKLLEGLASVTAQRNNFEEVMEEYVHENRRLSMHVADSTTQLAVQQQEIADVKMTLASMDDEKKQLEEERGFLVHERETLLGDLTDCKNLVAALQQESAGLNMNLALLTEEHNKLKDHEVLLSQDFERLSAELVVSQVKMSMQHQDHGQLEADLKEALSRLEQLAEENIILQSSLDIYKAKIGEVDNRQAHLPFEGGDVGTGFKCHDSAANIDSNLSVPMTEAESVFSSVGLSPDSTSERTVLSQLSYGVDDGASGAVTLPEYMEGAEKMMQILEEAMDQMHSQSAALSRTAGKAAAPGVSKLIQAFESKAIVDDHEPEGTSPTGNLVPSDPYSSAKEQIVHLRAVFKALAQNVDHVNALILEEKDAHRAANVAHGELEVEIEALKGINSSLEARNIELEVLCGAMNQHVHDIEGKKTQLEGLCEALQGQKASLQSQNIELIEKLKGCHSRISGLQFQLNEIQQSSDEVASAIYKEVEILQTEMREDISAADRQWRSALAELIPIVGKLDAVVGSAVSFPRQNETNQDLDILGHFSSSLNSACEMIEQLKMGLEAAGRDQEAISNSYAEVQKKLKSSDEERNEAIALLQKLSGDLLSLLNISNEHVDYSYVQERDSTSQYSLDAGYCEALVTKLGSLLGDRFQLKESYNKLYSDFLDGANKIEDLNRKRLDDGDALWKIFLDVTEVLKLQETTVDYSDNPILHLQSSVLLLIQKYKEADEQTNLLINDVNSRMVGFDELQGQLELLESVNYQQQSEILVLKQSLKQGKEGFDALQSELLEKVRGLEQSEQRVASVREKLSIAVAKGKGLVIQRDSLKQSLAEMSSELEKCSQELRFKDSELHEVKERLKAYSEAGERMEALESELSYIRNSATALRESFLLKDSTLQRIEEILEDLELPDYFHSKDITEKVDWLAKSVTGSSLPLADWDQRSSVGGGSYSDAGFVVTDGCKEDVQPSANPVDDLRRKYDELQTKFYELAEQNDMLEQSLMERNILVQRWEEILDKINTPPQIRSMEPEERIHWLGTALSEADQHMRSLQQKVENLENYCESLSGELEESQRIIAENESSLHAVVQAKEIALSESEDHLKSLQQTIENLENYSGSLSSELEESRRRLLELKSSLEEALRGNEILSSNFVTLTSERETALDTVAQNEQEVDRLEKEVDMLQSELTRLQGLIVDVLPDSGTNELPSELSNIEYLEALISRLVNRTKQVYNESHGTREAVQEHVTPQAATEQMTTAMENEHVLDGTDATMEKCKSRSVVCEEQVVVKIRRELAEALDEVANIRKDRDACLQKNQSEVEALERKVKELQELLNQEEQKSASLREKLNLAVRKGKSLVQQRDSLKQNIEEMTSEIDRLKSEISNREHSLVESGQKISDLSFQMEHYKEFETENISLKKSLMEAEQHLQQNGHTLSMLLSKLADIDAGAEINTHDPIQKLEGIGKLCYDLHAAAASYEQEAIKSKKAAELLVAELNEVQERNDGLQDEVARAYDEISTLSSERDLADLAKAEAVSHLSKLSEERRNQLADFEELSSTAHEVKIGFFEITTLLGDVFAKDLEVLCHLSTNIESCLEQGGAGWLSSKDHGGLISKNSDLKDLWSTNSSRDIMKPVQLDKDAELDVCKALVQHLRHLANAMVAFKEKIHIHSTSLNREREQLTTMISPLLREITSSRDSFESIKSELKRFESAMQEKDMESDVMRRSMSLLYEACTSSIIEIENRKALLAGESSASEDVRVNLPGLPLEDSGNFSGFTLSSCEDRVRALSNKLLLAVRTFVDIENESMEGRNKELRSTILNLQKELQEKDVQKERVCMELVSQIREAEATALNCSRDLQSMKNYAKEVESKLEATSNERSLLEHTVADLKQGLSNSLQLEERVKSVNGLLASKEQEIEALMQALDEEENQMEVLRRKVEELEKVVEQKIKDLEHVEASRAKAVKKLSVTVSKFDELHLMSEGLLSEIENLQSQLEDRDAEISFLRQEVTRCTNDVLEATKMAKVRSSGELQEVWTWLNTTFSHVLMHDAHGGDGDANPVLEPKQHLQKGISSIISELENLRVASQRKDSLLQEERNRLEELSHRKEALEVSLREKEVYLNSLQSAGDSGLATSEIVEVEPLLNKRSGSVTTASQVRSLRKINNDQVSIAIDTDAETSGRFEDDEDDKVHGFKSLTTSRFVPKFTRPVSDMIDGLWVSCDRTLMRQPAFRLGIMIYWAVLHALLASFIV